jgi:hypothetical protein
MNKKMIVSELVKIAKDLITAGIKYKDYTIEKSGYNFYVRDPLGHRAFGEVPASIEIAKKWIDMEIAEKFNSNLRRNQVVGSWEKPEKYYDAGFRAGQARKRNSEIGVSYEMAWFTKTIRMEDGTDRIEAKRQFDNGYQDGLRR